MNTEIMSQASNLMIEIVEFGLRLEGVIELFGVVELSQHIALLDRSPVRHECNQSDTVPLDAGDLGYLNRIDSDGAHEPGDADQRGRS